MAPSDQRPVGQSLPESSSSMSRFTVHSKSASLGLGPEGPPPPPPPPPPATAATAGDTAATAGDTAATAGDTATATLSRWINGGGLADDDRDRDRDRRRQRRGVAVGGGHREGVSPA